MNEGRMKVGVTGHTGFVGQRLLHHGGWDVELVTLPLRQTPVQEVDLSGIDAIVHLAGLAHQMRPVPASLYDEVNYTLTRALAEKASAAGVRHFVYISTTKVYGEDAAGHFDEHSACHPVDPYGSSKRKAEEHLLSMDDEKFRVAVVRPPLIYGPGVKGNMNKLLHLAAKPWPLPLGDTRNQRSMVFVDNLLALIETILDQRAGGVFIAGDASPLATSELIGLIRESMGNKLPVFSLPAPARKLIAKLRPAQYIRLFGSYVVDNTGTNVRLGFTPPFSTAEGVATMVEWFLQNRSNDTAA